MTETKTLWWNGWWYKGKRSGAVVRWGWEGEEVPEDVSKKHIVPVRDLEELLEGKS
jgi:hypothetical protein